MSLYFEECVEEERIAAADFEKDRIVFIFPWIIDIPTLQENSANMEFSSDMSVSTNYNIYSTHWNLLFTNDYFQIHTNDQEPIRFWKGSRFFITYKLFSDNRMRSEICCSDRIEFEDSLWSSLSNCVYTPDGSMKEFNDAFSQRKVAKVVVFVEFDLIKKYFIHPLNVFRNIPEESKCEKFPEDMDSDFKFEFLKEGDFTIKCLNGTVPALKMVLNLRPSILKKYLKISKNDEFVVEHSVDVVKPIITYLHSGCFEMPKLYNPNFADRLYKAIKFFELEDEQNHKIIVAVDQSLFQKFLTEPHDFDFETILQWASLCSRYSLYISHAVAVVIANKFYYQWLERFPENVRNAENEMLQTLFGSSETLWIFEKIENSFMSLIFVNSIMN